MAKLKTITLSFDGGLSYEIEVEKVESLDLDDPSHKMVLWELLAGSDENAPKSLNLELTVKAKVKHYTIKQGALR